MSGLAAGLDGSVMRPAARLACAALAAGCAISGQLVGLPAAGAAQANPAQAGPAQANPAHVAHRARAAPTGIVAAGGDLVNANTGAWLWSRGLHRTRPIASLTKVMTAIVVIRAGDLNRKITVTQSAENYAQAYNAGSAGLHPGDVLTARQLLEGLLLPSGADAAYLLANAYGPGWHRFVRKMNAAARALGMTQSHFANFDGLPWPSEYSTYSTPRDLIRMGQAAMKLRTFRDIVGLRSRWIGATRHHHRYYWKNTNLLVGSYPGAIGIKTGFTHGAGYCLLFEAKRGQRELMGVVLDSTGTDPASRFTAAARLLTWGFAG
jgi:serine-type D-Ala-D-Ala carboxypeptidase (penicillin-binding protein 5/6)